MLKMCFNFDPTGVKVKKRGLLHLQKSSCHSYDLLNALPNCKYNDAFSSFISVSLPFGLSIIIKMRFHKDYN